MTKDKLRSDFEKWFTENYLELFEKCNPLKVNEKGVYEDRGTLGMWIVWQKKSSELRLVEKQINILIGELYIKLDAIHFEEVVKEIRSVK